MPLNVTKYINKDLKAKARRALRLTSFDKVASNHSIDKLPMRYILLAHSMYI